MAKTRVLAIGYLPGKINLILTIGFRLLLQFRLLCSDFFCISDFLHLTLFCDWDFSAEGERCGTPQQHVTRVDMGMTRNPYGYQPFSRE